MALDTEPKEPEVEAIKACEAEEPEVDRHEKDESLAQMVNSWPLKLIRARIERELLPKLEPER